MLFAFLEALGFTDLVGRAQLRPGSGAVARGVLARRCRSIVAAAAGRLGADDRRRLAENPLRLFDSKDPAVARDSRRARRATLDFLDDGLARGTTRSSSGCSARPACASATSPSIVRGLDYYTRTVFEVASGGARRAERDPRRRPLRQPRAEPRRAADAGDRLRDRRGPARRRPCRRTSAPRRGCSSCRAGVAGRAR